MNFVIIGGFLGSGKTTLMLEFAKKLASNDVKVGILVNDFGEVAIDGDTVSDYGMNAIEITKGCVCCEVKRDLVTQIRDLKNSYDPDLIVLETSGVASLLPIHRTVQPYVNEIKTLTLIDISRYDKLIERFEVVKNQLFSADLVVINKIDKASSDELKKAKKKISKFLKDENPGARIIEASAKEGTKVDGIVNFIGESK
ncbi:hypothetical protein AKJ52_03035 [candidate division MSBL1 archaeon SCGC-AAA382C18]|uniref:CobW/HypB/UreG nucleotide-binding domain-containing protein n=1 Tax=candidate division MSBL1 archaeon SCGC-AAA382C18 TaxID=1698281 RepID=A0A133VH84_9EURY|nr:hypothetical protein AKJ52_03035 [candidate division MSBL1 archaeon SCGC-AAA382C18]